MASFRFVECCPVEGRPGTSTRPKEPLAAFPLRVLYYCALPGHRETYGRKKSALSVGSGYRFRRCVEHREANDTRLSCCGQRGGVSPPHGERGGIRFQPSRMGQNGCDPLFPLSGHSEWSPASFLRKTTGRNFGQRWRAVAQNIVDLAQLAVQIVALQFAVGLR